MKYHVYAFYPDLGLKVRITEHGSRQSMATYCGKLRLTDTPYVVCENFEKIIDINECGIDRHEMADIIHEYCG